MPAIEALSGREILDSRGKPTVSATCTLQSGVSASASVPSGASTGKAEAHELRDQDAARYLGQGCRDAAANIGGPICEYLRARRFKEQSELDRALIEIDGRPDKSRLGANALLAVSIAFARAVAAERKVPFYFHLADMIGHRPQHLPRLTVNLFSGGKHGGGQVPIQDTLLVPASARTIDEGLAMVYAVYQAAAARCLKRYDMRPLTADEGGLAPQFPHLEAMFEDAVGAIADAGLAPGRDVFLAIDVASSYFYRDGRYELGGTPLEGPAMIDRVAKWVKEYPIVSVEDGLAEDDWEHWPMLREAIGDRALVLGDDLLCTNPKRIARAVSSKAANALLLKVNQIGTLSEAAQSLKLARDAGWRVTVSARSGETEDNWLADLAVGWGGDQIKVGSITQSERLAKYNRLLEIEAETGLAVVGWPDG